MDKKCTWCKFVDRGLLEDWLETGQGYCTLHDEGVDTLSYCCDDFQYKESEGLE